jgi:hypothetical protein
MLFTCARSIHINTDRKELKQVLHFRFSFEPRFSEVDSLFLAPPLRTTSCNVHYSGPILYDNERETWAKSKIPEDASSNPARANEFFVGLLQCQNNMKLVFNCFKICPKIIFIEKIFLSNESFFSLLICVLIYMPCSL